MNILKTLSYGAAALVLGASASYAAVIDFESLADPTNGFVDPGGSYSEDGFDLNAGRFRSAGSGNATYYTGSAALFEDVPNGTITLTASDNSAFSLNSIDLSEIDTTRLGPTTVTFTGIFALGGSISQSLTLDGIFGMETLVFAGFTGLSSVSWQQTPSFHQFDNINLNAIPVPAALPLLLAGLGGLGFMGRRRKAA